MIVNLSVHKNTLAQRKAKYTRSRMKEDTRDMMATRDLNGYAIVAWDKQGECRVSWSMGDTDPMTMPDKVRNAIIRVQVKRDLKDD